MKIKNLHLCIYVPAFLISIVLIGLYFINPNYSWCILSCSIGASTIGASLLGFIIDWTNESKRTEDNKNTLISMFSLFRLRIYSLIRYMYDCIRNIYEIMDEDIEIFSNGEIKTVLFHIANGSEKISHFIASKLLSDDKAYQCDDKENNKTRIKEMLRKDDMVFKGHRDGLLQEYNDFIKKEPFLISLGICDAKYVECLKNILQVLSSPIPPKTKEYELFVFGMHIKEIIESDWVVALEKIGFDKLSFSNRGVSLKVKQLREIKALK